MANTTMGNDKYWLGFNLVSGIGPAKLDALLSALGSVEAAWHATPAEMRRIGLDRRTIRNLRAAQQALDLDERLAALQEQQIGLWHWESADYPAALRALPDPPPLLYTRGAWQAGDDLAVAIVGTRRPTTYGRLVTEEIASTLASQGVTIVSGLARGIDGFAHRSALDVGGRTIAVLGSGVNQIYPPENRKLAERIADGGGMIVSEYAPNTQPEAKNFPPRNRVISGLSLGVVVVEARQRSGALITADFALEQGRDLFAVPGNITSPTSAGPNRLIADGAKLITSADDILRELELTRVQAQQAVQIALPESAEEALLLSKLSRQPQHIDALCRAVELPMALVSSTLTLMELKGMVRQVGNMQYTLREALSTYEPQDDS